MRLLIYVKRKVFLLTNVKTNCINASNTCLNTYTVLSLAQSQISQRYGEFEYWESGL
jgi:hypothetical protein